MTFLNRIEPYLPFVIFALGFWFFCTGILGSDLAYIPGDLGDSRFINYLLEHGYQFIIGDQDSFWNATFMHPFPNTIAISDNMIGTLPIYAVFRFTGMEQELAYQFWWMSICALNYWLTFIVIKKWFKRTDLAILVAFVFAFSIFNLYQLNYMQMTIRFIIPFTIYAATKLVETGKHKYFLYFSLGLLIQYYCVIYTAFFLMYFSFGYIAVYATVSKRWSFVRELFVTGAWKKTILIGTSGILLLLLLMYPYLEMSRILGFKMYDDVKWNIPMINGYFLPHSSSLFWGWMHEVARPNREGWWLQSVFIGFVPLFFLFSIPALWIYWKVKKIKVNKLVLALTITIAGIALLFVRLENGLTLYAAIFKFPGMNSMRVLNRYMHVQLFFILLLMVLLLKDKSKWIVYSLFALIVFDNMFVGDRVNRSAKKDIIARREAMVNKLVEADAPFYQSYAVVTNSEKPFLVHIDAMMASLRLRLPTINAYTSSGPTDYAEFFLTPQRKGLEHWIQYNKMDSTAILVLEVD